MKSSDFKVLYLYPSCRLPFSPSLLSWFSLFVVLTGAFTGILLAAPAFAVMTTAEQPSLTSGGVSTPESGQTSLRNYLSCDSVAVWQKFVAIFP